MQNHDEPPQGSLYALQARIRKKQEAESLGITVDYISSFVERFYSRIRDDGMLGPIFGAHVVDWSTHIDRMKSFWRSVLHSSGEYSGNPMSKHRLIPNLDENHFSHWLLLLDQTLREQESYPDATKQINALARTIARSLLNGIQDQNHKL